MLPIVSLSETTNFLIAIRADSGTRGSRVSVVDEV